MVLNFLCFLTLWAITLSSAALPRTQKELITQRAESLRLLSDANTTFVDVAVGNSTHRLRRLDALATSLSGYSSRFIQQTSQGLSVRTTFIDFTLRASSSMDVTKFMMTTETAFTKEFRSHCTQISRNSQATAGFIFNILGIGSQGTYSKNEKDCASSLSQSAKDDLKKQFNTISSAFVGTCAVSGVTIQFSTPTTPFIGQYILSTLVYNAGGTTIEMIPAHQQLVWDPYRVEDLATHLSQDDLSNVNRVLLGMLQDASSKVTGIALSTEQSNQYLDCEVKTDDPNYDKCKNDHTPHDESQPNTSEDLEGAVVDKEEGRRKRCELQIRAANASGSSERVAGCEDFY